MGELAGAPADVGAVLAGQLAQAPLVDVGNVLGGERAGLEVPFEAYGAGALAFDAELRAVVAAGFIRAGARGGALGGAAVAF